MKILLLLLLIIPFVQADVTPENSRALEGCITIENLDDFPDLYFIGHINAVSSEDENYIIKQGECLTKGYKFNELTIWATKRSYVSSTVKVIDDLTLNGTYVLAMDGTINPYLGYVDETSSLIRKDIEYTIAGFADNKLIIYKSKEVETYNNETSPQTEEFDSPDTANLRITFDIAPVVINNTPVINITTNQTNTTTNTTANNTEIPKETKTFREKVICFLKKIIGKSC